MKKHTKWKFEPGVVSENATLHENVCSRAWYYLHSDIKMTIARMGQVYSTENSALVGELKNSRQKIHSRSQEQAGKSVSCSCI